MIGESEYSRFLSEHGEQQLGTEDLLLSRADTFAAVALARNEGLAILGGDVYVRRQGKIEPAYANWQSSRRRDEAPEVYAQRTCNETEEFLRRYPETGTGEVLFALVTDE